MEIRQVEDACPRFGATVIEATNVGASGNTGVEITAVRPGCTASKAGLRVGDVITFLGANEIQDRYEFLELIMGAQPGDTQLTLIRDGKTYRSELVLSGPAWSQQKIAGLLSTMKSENEVTSLRLNASDASRVPGIGDRGVEFLDQTLWRDLTGGWTGKGRTPGGGPDSEDWVWDLNLSTDREIITAAGSLTTTRRYRPVVGYRATKKELQAADAAMRPKSGTVAGRGTLYNGKDVNLNLTAHIEGRVIEIAYSGRYDSSGRTMRLTADGHPPLSLQRSVAPAATLHPWASWSGMTRDDFNLQRSATLESAQAAENNVWVADCKQKFQNARSTTAYEAVLIECAWSPGRSQNPDADLDYMIGRIYEEGLSGKSDLPWAMQYFQRSQAKWISDPRFAEAVARVNGKMPALSRSLAKQADAARTKGQAQEALNLYLNAARHGDHPSLLAAARLIEQGPAMPTPSSGDRDTDTYWAYVRAADAGQKPAAQWLMRYIDKALPRTEQRYRDRVAQCESTNFITLKNGYNVVFQDGAAEKRQCFANAEYDYKTSTQQFRENRKHWESLLNQP